MMVTAEVAVMPPPRAGIAPNPSEARISSRSRRSRLRLPRPRKQSATAKVTGNHDVEPGCVGEAVLAGVTMRVVVAEATPGSPAVLLGANAAMVAGLKAHEQPLGYPLQAKATYVRIIQ